MIVCQAPERMELYLSSWLDQTQMLCIQKIAVHGWKSFGHLEKVS
jgi:hypothetical protein